jgi:uncharacterized membrane protein
MARRNEPVRRILTAEDEARVVAAIRAAEMTTSGEIRVHAEARAGREPIAAARRWFHHLGMDRTKLRNGVLVYLAVDDRAFAIVGDRGIHEKVGDAGWSAIRDRIQAAFAEGRFADGLEDAIRSVGGILAEHFPPGDGDRNELPDEVSR